MTPYVMIMKSVDIFSKIGVFFVFRIPILENRMNIYLYIFIKLSITFSTNTHTVMNVRILTNIISFILVLFGILVTTVLLHPLYRYVNEEEIFREMNDEWNPVEYKIYCKMLVIHVNALRGVYWETGWTSTMQLFFAKMVNGF